MAISNTGQVWCTIWQAHNITRLHKRLDAARSRMEQPAALPEGLALALCPPTSPSLAAHLKYCIWPSKHAALLHHTTRQQAAKYRAKQAGCLVDCTAFMRTSAVLRFLCRGARPVGGVWRRGVSNQGSIEHHHLVPSLLPCLPL